MKPPSWLDRRTVEYCEQMLDALAARVLQRWPTAEERRTGIEVGRDYLRILAAELAAARPPLRVVE